MQAARLWRHGRVIWLRRIVAKSKSVHRGSPKASALQCFGDRTLKAISHSKNAAADVQTNAFLIGLRGEAEQSGNGAVDVQLGRRILQKLEQFENGAANI